MKIRNGFVSNSSSSSFIVAYKGEKPTVVTVMKSFGIAKDALAAKMFEGVFKVLLSAKSISKGDIDELREYSPNCDEIKLLDGGWKVLVGGASDEDDNPSESFLCFSDIDLSTDTLRVIKRAGY